LRLSRFHCWSWRWWWRGMGPSTSLRVALAGRHKRFFASPSNDC